jgi:cytochrome P450
VAAAFTPRSVEALRGPCAELAHELLPDGRFDLLRDFAQPYSIAVICRLLGVPTDRGRDLLDWSHTMVKMYELDTTLEQAEAATQAAAEFRDYVLRVVGERRREPQDDLVTRLVEVEVEGRRLTDAELVSTIIVLLNAGHEATVNTLGNGVLALLRHERQWARLVAGEVGPDAAVEELIRWDPPLQLFERWVLEDGVEIAGEPSHAARRWRSSFGSANRDPRAFADPDAFDVGARERGRAHRLRRRHPRLHRRSARADRAGRGTRCARGAGAEALPGGGAPAQPRLRHLGPRRPRAGALS